MSGKHTELEIYSGEARSSNASNYAPALGRLTDLELPVAVMLGSAAMPIQEVLKITSGSLIELNRQVNENVDLTIYGKLVARGEIVSIKGNYGVRIKEIVSRQERIAFQP